MTDFFVYDCNLNIECFVHMLDDPTECYKFYWLDSIMQLLSQGKEDICFDDVISGMIADAWYSVTEYHLRMGTLNSQGESVNSIERAVNKIEALNILEHTADRMEVLRVIEENPKLLREEKSQLSKNVPYRLLSSFLKEVGGNDPLWDQKNRLICYLEMLSQTNCMPYTIGKERGLDKRVNIDKRWKKFMLDNMVAIRGWIQMKKIKYLQDRNPGVPGIIYKLEPENERQRRLQNVRKLWKEIAGLVKIVDIYTGDVLPKQYEIDHFVPWSFIANDEMWNLIPVSASKNSSKRDKLPDWNKYFGGFAKNQFALNTAIYEYPVIRNQFKKCQRDNLNSLWSLEELYVEEAGEDEFTRILEKHLHPIYESARNQGYRIWSS